MKQATLDVGDLVARRPAGQSLEAPFYVGEEFFDLDIEAVFARSWLFVAAEAELPEPGDYVTVGLGSYSVIVVRDDDEDVRAFHNVCRHRGRASSTRSAARWATSSAGTTAGPTASTANCCTPSPRRPASTRPASGCGPCTRARWPGWSSSASPRSRRRTSTR
ncbi:Rieske 2Fe-2S domain-containing protein [Streptomyces sp. L7]